MIIYGTNFYGKIKTVGGQAIKTRFFHLFWLPIIPLGSMFVLGEDDDNVLGFEMKPNVLSVLLAYLRRFMGVIILGGIIIFFVEDDIEAIYVAAGPVVPWIASMILGRANKEEKYERILLGLATTIFGYPEWIPAEKAREIMQVMENQWDEMEKAKDWKQAISSKFAATENIPLLFSLARYDHFLNNAPGTEIIVKEALLWARQQIPEEELLDMDFDYDNEDDTSTSSAQA